MENELVVTTLTQKVHFIMEIRGQLSDGKWENASPPNHWGVWCRLKWDQVKVGEDYGHNFFAVKTNYDLTNKDFLGCVGHRMIFRAKLFILNRRLANFKWDSHQLPDGKSDWDWHKGQLAKAESKLAAIEELATFPNVDNPSATKENLDKAIGTVNYDERLIELVALIGNIELAKKYRCTRSDFDYYRKWFETLSARGVTERMVMAAESSDCYTMLDLRKDMAEMRKAFKRNSLKDPLPTKGPIKRAGRKVLGQPVHLRDFYRFSSPAAPLQLLKTAAPSRFADLVDMRPGRTGSFTYTEQGMAEFTSVDLARYMVGAGLEVVLRSTKNNAAWAVANGGPDLVVLREEKESIAEFVRE
jgi:hypothetical protein